MSPNLLLLSKTVEMTPEFVAAVVITGFVLTFVCLIILILFVQFLGKLVNKLSKKKILNQPKNNGAVPASKTDASKAVSPVVSDGIDDEVVVVITAAIAAMSASSGKKLVLKSISKSATPMRKPWAMAGLQENTKPF